MKSAVVSVLALASLFSGYSVYAQESSECDGVISILRISNYVNTGTVKEELPEGFQKSEYVEKTGFVDLIVERKDLASKIGTLLSILLNKNSDISTEENETTENTQSLSRAAS